MLAIWQLYWSITNFLERISNIVLVRFFLQISDTFITPPPYLVCITYKNIKFKTKILNFELKVQNLKFKIKIRNWEFKI